MTGICSILKHIKAKNTGFLKCLVRILKRGGFVGLDLIGFYIMMDLEYSVSCEKTKEQIHCKLIETSPQNGLEHFPAVSADRIDLTYMAFRCRHFRAAFACTEEEPIHCACGFP